MSTLIIPCAGRSTRFPNSRPKWSLTHPYGDLMFIQSIKGLDLSKYSEVVSVFLKDDVERFNLLEGLNQSLGEIDAKTSIVLLEQPTSSQSETVAEAISALNIKGDILIKDCDAYFTAEYASGNFVYTSNLRDVSNIKASSKSYVDVDKNGIIQTIVEKDVISNEFCCGGYGFSDAEKFVETYKKLKDSAEGEIYVSHIIFQQLLDGEQFITCNTSNFNDWGTLKDWNEYKKQYKTLFLDLDGVLVENSGEYVGKKWGTTDALESNKDYINNLYETGKVRIIFTTSRKSKFRDETISQLEKCGIKYHTIIFDLLHCQRILVNDFSSSNSFPTAKAVNLPRNNDNLEEYLSESF